jgi:hypothetical protein
VGLAESLKALASFHHLGRRGIADGHPIGLFVSKRTTDVGESVDERLPGAVLRPGWLGRDIRRLLGGYGIDGDLEQSGGDGLDRAALNGAPAGKLGFHFGPDVERNGHGAPPGQKRFVSTRHQVMPTVKDGV